MTGARPVMSRQTSRMSSIALTTKRAAPVALLGGTFLATGREALRGWRTLRRPRCLDMGCGSAILALAALRARPGAGLVAADNDPVAVRTAAENGRINRVAPRRLRTLHAQGYAARPLRAALPVPASRLPHRLIVPLLSRVATPSGPGTSRIANALQRVRAIVPGVSALRDAPLEQQQQQQQRLQRSRQHSGQASAAAVSEWPPEVDALVYVLQQFGALK